MTQSVKEVRSSSPEPSTFDQNELGGQGFLLSRWQRVSTAGLFLGSLVFHLLNFGLVNDHFDRIARGRQIAQYGELPFRDFFDPGYFLTLFSSAAVQILFGDNLLGEALLNVVCFSIGFALTFVLLIRTTRSLLVAAVITALIIAVGSRFYDYDKVLFYPLGIFLCWRYIDRTASRDLIALALGTVLAFWFRYDNGIFVACPAVVALVVVHWRNRVTFVRRLGLYASVVVMASLPFLMFLQAGGGVLEYIQQIASYASREGRRTEVFRLPRLTVDATAPLVVIEPPAGYPITVRWVDGVDDSARSRLEQRFSLANPEFDGERTWSYTLHNSSAEHVSELVTDPLVEDTGSIDRGTSQVVSSETLEDRVRRVVPFLRMQILPGVLSRDNIIVFAYYLFITIPVLAVMVVWRNISRNGPSCRWEPEAARALSLTTMCVLIEGFILRAPLDARIGPVALPVAVLGLWVVVNTELSNLHGDTTVAVIPGARKFAGRLRRVLYGARTAVLVRVILCVGLAVGALSVSYNFLSSIKSPTLGIGARLAGLAVSPPAETLLPNGRNLGLIRYVRECTAPSDRVLATWFIPQLYSYAGRGFAGGMVVFFGGHWSDRLFQRRILSQLREESVPIVIIETGSYPQFRQDYDLVDNYIRAKYRIAGESNLGNPDVGGDAYRVMVRKGLTPVRTEESWQLPCFR